MADKIQRSYYLPPDLVQWLRMRAAKENEPQSTIVERAIRALKNGAPVESGWGHEQGEDGYGTRSNTIK